MTERHIFASGPARKFAVGDLIRRKSTGNFINIVLEVIDKVIEGKDCQLIRSVRYGDTNGGLFVLLNGERSRWFKIDSYSYPDWDKVIEYTPYDNSRVRDAITTRLKNVDTTWRPNETNETQSSSEA